MLVVEDGLFPSGSTLRESSALQKKSDGKYDLEWIYDQTNLVGNITMKMLYLNRNFYSTVASHSNHNGGFMRHAAVLNDFAWYIFSEYERIDAKDPDVWRQISYEWFTSLPDCPKLIEALADFLGLKNCHFEMACDKIRKHVRTESLIETNTTEMAMAEGFNSTIPIKLLDYVPWLL